MLKLKLLLFSLIALFLVGQIQAQNKWGVSLTGGYDIPIAGLSDWYSGTGRYGGKIIFVSSKSHEIEIEYNYSKFTDGSIADRKFSYKSMIKYPDDEGNLVYRDSLYSSNGSSYMTLHSITVNTVKYFDRMNFLNARFLFTGGVGFYIHNHRVDSLLYSGRPIIKDKEIYMDPYSDKRVALGFNIGGGIDFKITERTSIELRAKYNFFISELRPLEAYRYEGEGFESEGKDIGGLENVFPIQYIDVSASFKFYFN